MELTLDRIYGFIKKYVTSTPHRVPIGQAFQIHHHIFFGAQNDTC